jgi:hypothetical protein
MHSPLPTPPSTTTTTTTTGSKTLPASADCSPLLSQEKVRAFSGGGVEEIELREGMRDEEREAMEGETDRQDVSV